MALLKFGAIITDSRGSLGGHSFKWSRYGSVGLHKPQGPRRRTPLQSTVRASFEFLSRYWWDSLTPTQRTDWRALAAANPLPNRWGEDFPLTGLAFFLRVNLRLGRAGAGFMFTAPADQTVDTLTSASIAITSTPTASLTFGPSPVPTDHVLVVRASPQLSPGIASAPHRKGFIAAAAATTTSPLNILSALTAITGTLHAGRQVFLSASFLSLDTGAASPEIELATLVT